MVMYSFSKGYKIKLDNLLYNENPPLIATL